MKELDRTTPLSRIKSLNWNAISDWIVVFYLTMLLFQGYSGGFRAFDRGSELEELLRATLITLAYVGTIGYLVFGMMKKVYFLAGIIILCTLPLLLFGLLYYSFGRFSGFSNYETIHALFLQFTLLHTWLCVHAFYQFKSKKKGYFLIAVLAVLLLMFLF